MNTAITDNVALKVFGTKIDYDGFMKNVTTGSGVAEKDYSNVGATLLFEVGDNFEALLTVEGFSDKGTLDAFHTNYNTRLESFLHLLLVLPKMTIAGAF